VPTIKPLKQFDVSKGFFSARVGRSGTNHKTCPANDCRPAPSRVPIARVSPHSRRSDRHCMRRTSRLPHAAAGVA